MRSQGFTLIEISIVLVIVGLIVGGVLVGRELIDNASMRKVISDIEKYQTAANTFREKYGAYPGDYSHALSMFPIPAAATSFGSTCVTWNNSALCNGNGNGQVEPSYYDSSIASWYAEEFQFWSHLQAAGLIPGGNYTGLWSLNSHYQVGVDCPAVSGFAFSCVASFWLGYQNFYFSDGNYGQVFEIAGGNPGGAHLDGLLDELNAPVFTTAQAKYLDAKVDDGRAAVSIDLDERVLSGMNRPSPGSDCLLENHAHIVQAGDEAAAVDLPAARCTVAEADDVGAGLAQAQHRRQMLGVVDVSGTKPASRSL